VISWLLLLHQAVVRMMRIKSPLKVILMVHPELADVAGVIEALVPHLHLLTVPV